jgi:hypothetical protein
MTVFNLANMVLMLNLIIAILSSTYSQYENKKIGLYYEVLIGKMPELEFDEKYGAAACAQASLHLMIFPLQWVVIFDFFTEQQLLDYNEFLCHLLYLPLSVIFTAMFLVTDIISVPFAYLVTTYRLFLRIFDE